MLEDWSEADRVVEASRVRSGLSFPIPGRRNWGFAFPRNAPPFWHVVRCPGWVGSAWSAGGGTFEIDASGQRGGRLFAPSRHDVWPDGAPDAALQADELLRKSLPISNGAHFWFVACAVTFRIPSKCAMCKVTSPFFVLRFWRHWHFSAILWCHFDAVQSFRTSVFRRSSPRCFVWIYQFR